MDEPLIQEIRAARDRRLHRASQARRGASIGDEIEVVEGPLKGLRGIFKKDLSDQDRVLILLNYVSYQGQLLIEKKKLKKVIY